MCLLRQHSDEITTPAEPRHPAACKTYLVACGTIVLLLKRNMNNFRHSSEGLSGALQLATSLIGVLEVRQSKIQDTKGSPACCTPRLDYNGGIKVQRPKKYKSSPESPENARDNRSMLPRNRSSVFDTRRTETKAQQVWIRSRGSFKTVSRSVVVIHSFYF